MAVPKKHETKAEEEKVEKKSATLTPEAKEEIVAEEVVIKTPGPVEIIEGAPKEVKEEAKIEETQSDPLTEFKERMNKEEFAGFDVPKKKNFMWPILIIFVIAILLLVGIFLYKHGVKINNTKEEVAKTKSVPTATPEPTKAVDLTKYEIELLNGSGVDGEASKEKAALEDTGFTISSIGNADNSDYTDTIIKAKANVDKAFTEKLKSTLEDTFTVGDIQTLSDDSSVPVVVIIGTEK